MEIRREMEKLVVDGLKKLHGELWEVVESLEKKVAMLPTSETRADFFEEGIHQGRLKPPTYDGKAL